jgi:hypothetical protein
MLVPLPHLMEEPPSREKKINVKERLRLYSSGKTRKVIKLKGKYAGL